MTTVRARRFGLSGTALKVLACVCMTIDHIGAFLLPQWRIMRIIGRIAFPIFAFCIAEGCRYTKNKSKRFWMIFGSGAVWELLLILYYGEWEGNIFLTLSLSVLLIYGLQAVKKQLCCGTRLHGMGAVALYLIALVAVYGALRCVHVEYGFYGVMLAPAAALFDYTDGEAPSWMRPLDCLPVKLFLFAAALVVLALPTLGRGVQIWSLLAIPILALYNGAAGTQRLKYAFYVFYPLHLIVIEILRIIGKKGL